MGGTNWSNSFYAAKTEYKKLNNIDDFDYSKKVKSGVLAKKAHENLDPKLMKNNARECRDSDNHPNSKPIYIGLDVTGSMSEVPGIIQKALPQLMGLLIRKGYLEHPAICMSGIGDANYDTVPFQVGQFESGIEIDNDIDSLFLEGGGGGNSYESYELALYFLARCVFADEFEKRNGKGYAFIICDESLTHVLKKNQVKAVFGHNIQDDIQVSDLIKEVLEKWELFVIVPNMTSHYNSTTMKKYWKELLGQRVLLLDDPANISEFISATIGMNEGNVDEHTLTTDLVEFGVTKTVADKMSRSLAVINTGKELSVKGSGLTTL